METIPGRGEHRLAAVMAALTAAFFLRVAGQAVQRWAPQAWLPPFGEWQGSTTPYMALIAIQLAILAGMIYATVRVYGAKMARSAYAGRWWSGFGAIYMTIALARVAIGLAVPDAPRWFSAYISGIFHIVLAAFVLALARYHRDGP